MRDSSRERYKWETAAEKASTRSTSTRCSALTLALVLAGLALVSASHRSRGNYSTGCHTARHCQHTITSPYLLWLPNSECSTGVCIPGSVHIPGSGPGPVSASLWLCLSLALSLSASGSVTACLCLCHCQTLSLSLPVSVTLRLRLWHWKRDCSCELAAWAGKAHSL